MNLHKLWLSIVWVAVIMPLASCSTAPTTTTLAIASATTQPLLPTLTITPTFTPTKTLPHTSTLKPFTSPTVTLTRLPTLTPQPCALAKEGPLAGIDPRGQTILWWHNYSGEKDLYALVFGFNYTNDCDIRVELKYQGSYSAIHNKMMSAIANKSVPDLVVGYQNDQAAYQKNNNLVDLNLYLNDAHWGLSPEEQADFYPSFWNQSVHPAYDHQRLGFALNRSMEVLFYNMTWAKELGFDRPPETPAEFEEQACAAAAARGDGTGGYILRNNASAVAAWTFAFGGNVLDETGARYVFDSQPTIDALTMLKRMVERRCAFYYRGYPNTAFAGRRALFTQGSSSGLSFYLKDMEKSSRGDQFLMIAIPHTTSSPRQNVYGGDISIPVTTPERQLAAWIFIKWLTSTQVQTLWVKVSNYYPTRLSATELLSSYQRRNPIWSSGFDLLPFAVYEPQLISYESVRVLVSKTFDQIMHGDGTNIRELLTELTQKANEMQEKSTH